MAEQKKIVEINGRKYDASTGQPVSKKRKQPQQHQVIDGFRKSRSNASRTKTSTKKTAHVSKKVSAHNVHKKPQKSATLSRKATKKPASKRASKSQHGHKQTNKLPPHESEEISTNLLARSLNTSRFQRARKHKRSSLISKFGSQAPNEEVTDDQPPPEPTPEPTDEKPAKALPATTSKQLKKQLVDEALAKETPAKPKKRSSRAKRFVKRRPKLVTATAAVMAALVIGGYVVYLNIPNMALRVAASRAGFDASLPAYSPSGFDFDGPIAYSKGQVTIQFTSNTDDREFTITQRESTWDSKSLLDNFVSREAERHLTFQERGLTIYVYNNSDAAWVNGGIWYTIEGESDLNSDQLLKIASSL